MPYLTAKRYRPAKCLPPGGISPVPVDLQADLAGFRGADDDFVKDFFVPGIQRAGGLRAARELVN